MYIFACRSVLFFCSTRGLVLVQPRTEAETQGPACPLQQQLRLCFSMAAAVTQKYNKCTVTSVLALILATSLSLR